MARRRPSKHLRPHRPLALGRQSHTDTKSDGQWVVTRITAEGAAKPYRCPGCEQLIKPGTAHLVTWPHTPTIGSVTGVEDRRHWHSSCWQRRR